jgi:AAA domain-containing protein
MDTQHALTPVPRSLANEASKRRTMLAVIAIVAVSLLMQIGAVILSYLNRVVPAREDLSSWPNDLLYSLVFLSALGVGALIALRRPDHPYGRLWLLSAVASAFQSFTRGYAGYALLAAPNTLPGGELALLLTAASWFILIGIQPFLLLLFPTGRLPSPRWCPVAWAVVGAGVLTSGIGWAAPGPSAFIPAENPLGAGGTLGAMADLVRNIGVLFVFAVILAGIVSVGLRFRRAEGVERQQFKWFALGGALLGADLIAQFFLSGVLGDISGALATAALPITTGIAILRHRLFDIDVIIRKTLIYGALTACVAGVYALIIGVAGVLLPTQTSLLPALVTVAVAALLFRPLNRLLQRLPLPKGKRADDAEGLPAPIDQPVLALDGAAATSAAPKFHTTPSNEHLTMSAAPGQPAVIQLESRARGLRLARALWVLIVAISTTQFVIGTPFRYTALREPCMATATICEEQMRFSPAVAELLASLGLLLETYAAVTLALVIGTAVVWLAVAVLILIYRSDDWMGLLTALMLALLGPGLFSGAMALEHAWPAWWLLSKLVGLCAFTAAILFFYLFPTGRFAPRWSRWFALAWLVNDAVAVLADDQPSWLSTVSFFGFFIPAIASIVFLIYRYRRVADQVQRQQVKWVVFGTAGTLGTELALVVLAILIFGSLDDPRSTLLLTVQPVLFLGIPLSIGIAILRHRLFDIDLIIRRTLIYGAVTACLGGLYALAVGVTSMLLPTQRDLLPILFTLVLTVFLARPLYRLLQRLPLPQGALIQQVGLPASPADSPKHADAAAPRQARRTRFVSWFEVMRAAWALMAVLVLLLLVAGMPLEYAYYNEICTGAACATDTLSERLTMPEAEILQAQGISIGVYAAYAVLLEAIPALVYAAVAALIFWRRSGDRMGLFATFTLLTAGCAIFFAGPLATHIPALWLPATLMNYLGQASFVVFFYVFPDGCFAPPWTRWLAVGASVWWAASLFVPDVPLSLSGPAFFGLLASLIVLQIYRYQHVSNAVQRQQTKWVVYGFAMAIVGFLGSIALHYLTQTALQPDPLGQMIGHAVLTGFLLLIPLSIGTAILRHRLFDIDVIIRRTVIYGALTACIGGLYTLAVGAASLLLPTQSDLLPVLVTLAVAVFLARPLYRLLQRLPLPQAAPAEDSQTIPLAPTTAISIAASLTAFRANRAVIRAIWTTLALTMAALFVIGTARFYDRLQQVCTGDCGGPYPPFDRVQSLAQAGISLQFYAAYTVALETLFTLVMLGIGAIAIWRTRTGRAGVLTGFALLLFIAAFTNALPLAGEGAPALLPLTLLLTWLGQIALVTYFCVFPDGYFRPRWTRVLPVAWAIYVLPVLPAEPVVDLPPFYAIGFVVCFGLLIAAQIYRYRRVSNFTQRQQSKWVVFGFVGGIGTFITGLTIPTSSDNGPAYLINNTTIYICFLCIPVSIGIAILRHRLFDIDVIIRRTIMYVALTACLGGLYALAVGAAGLFLPTQGDLLPILVTLAVAVPLARPLYRFLQRLPLPQGQPRPMEESGQAVSGTNWRLAARAAGVIVALAAIGIFAVSIPVAYSQYQNVRTVDCVQQTSACLAQPTGEEAAALAALGLSLPAYAALVIGFRVLAAAFYIAVALVVLWRKPNDTLALFVAFMLVIFGTATAPDTMPVLAAAQPSWQMPVAFMNFLGVSCFGLYLSLFPSGTFAPRWSRWVAGVWVIWTALANLVPNSPFDARSGSLPAGAVFMGLLGAQLFAQVYRYRRVSDSVQRAQTKWVVLGVAASLAVLLGAIAVGIAFPALFRANSLAGEAIYRLSLLILPLTLGIAILRYRLFDIDVIIRRTVIYGALTACVASVYALAVGTAGVLLHTQSALLPLLVTLAVAVPLVRPLYRLLQRLPLPKGQAVQEEDALLVPIAQATPGLHRGAAMSKRVTTRLAWALAGVSIVLTLLGLMLEAVNRAIAQHGTFIYTNSVVLALCFPVVGMLIAARQPRNPIGWLFCAIGLSAAIPNLAIPYAVYTLRVNPGALPGGALMTWLGVWAWLPGISLFPLLLLLFPSGRLLSPRWRWAVWATALGATLDALDSARISWPQRGTALLPYLERGIDPPIDGGVLSQILAIIGFPVSLSGLIASIIAMALRFRRSRGVERQQLKWLTYAITLAACILLVVIVLAFIYGESTKNLLDLGLIALSTISFVGVAAATGIAILRHRLFDIDVIIRRTVIYGALTASVAGIYALAVGAAGLILPTQDVLLALLVTLAVAVPLARPLYRLLQRLPLPEGAPAQHREAPAMIANSTAQQPHEEGMSARRTELVARVAPWFGVLSAIASVSMAIGAMVFSALIGRPLVEALAMNSLGVVFLALSFAAVGALVMVRRPLHPLGWIYCLIALCECLGIFAWGYATYGLVTKPGSLLGSGLMSLLAQAIWYPGLVLALTFALLLFPTGRLPSPRWRPLAWLSGILLVPNAIFVLANWPYRGRILLEHPEQLPTAWLGERLGLILGPAPLLLGLASLISLVVRFRRASVVERQQIKWIAYGCATLLAGFLIQNVIPPFAPGTGLHLLLLPFSIGIPLAAGIAILRHRLFDIDLIIRRTVVYSALVAALAVVYFGSVALIQWLAQAFTGPQSNLAIVALTLLVAMLFNPLRLRVQSFIDRRFYREKVDFRQAFTSFAREVRTVIELPALLQLLVERTTDLLHIAHGGVFLRDEGGAFYLAEGRNVPTGADALPADTDALARLAQGEPIAHPRDAAFPLLMPLLAPRPGTEHSVGTELVGVLALGPRLSDQRYSRDDESLLLGLADQAGTAIYVAQLIAAQRAEAERREEQERQLEARRASPIGRAEAAAEALLHDQGAALLTLHQLANEAGQSAEAARLLEHLPRAIGLLDHPAAPRLTGLADGLSYLVFSREQPELLAAGLRTLITHLDPGAGELIDGAPAALYGLCTRALEASTVAEIGELLPQLSGAAHAGYLAGLAQALSELHEAASALRAYERVDTPQDRLAYLAAAVERLSRVDRSAAELGAADQPLVQRIAEHWLAITTGVMGELQTRARLACRLLTRHTWQDDLVALTLTIRNDGRGAALNLHVSLTAGGEYTPLDAPAQVEQLASGEEVSLTLRVRPRLADGATYFRARFLIRYDDPRGPDQVEQFADEVQLLAEESPFQFIPNPYVVGTPLQNGSPLFFGRQDVLGFIGENVQAAHRNNLVLIGQRRTGKTSLLKQLPDRLGDAYVPIYLDGQSLGLDPGMPAFFLALATEIAFALDDRGFSLDPPEPEEFATSPAAAFERGFLPRVRQATGGRHLLLLLDEFEELEAAVRRGSLDASLFGFLRHLVQHSADLSVIFCGTHRLEELAADYWSVLFNISLYRHVGFLSRDEAERLIQQPVAPFGMRYDGLALEKIWRITSGHPYFLQLLCHSMVNRHNKNGRSYLTVADLNDGLEEILAAGEAHFVYLWTESNEHERLVLAALSRAVPLTGRATSAHIADELAERGVALERGAVAAALHRLALRDILTATDNADGALGDAYGWKLGLLGLWVEKYRSLSRVIDEVRG